MIELSNYEEGFGDLGFDGHGGSQEAQQLIKAMQAGQITGRDTTDLQLTQEPLKAESLEKTLKLLDYRMKDIQLWHVIPKLPAYNTVEEFLQLESYGTDRGGFYNEGELSDVEDSVYVRRAEQIKYIQVTGEVTYQAQIVRSHVEAMRQEIENKTMWVMRKVNTALTKADSTIVDQEFNGLYEQHGRIGGTSGVHTSLDEYDQSNKTIDLRGVSLTQSDLEDSSINVDANFGNVTDLFAPPVVISGLSKDYYQRQRILMQASGYKGTIGTNPKAIDTSFGEIALRQDKFMKADPVKNLAAAATSLKAPTAPTVDNNAALTGADLSSKFLASGELVGGVETTGTVFYALSAINRYGESALTVASNGTKVTLTAGESIDLDYTDGGGAIPATGYVIYRTFPTSSTDATADLIPFYPLFRVSIAQLAAGYDGGAVTIIRDRNRILPRTEQAFVAEMSTGVMSFKQLAPISKMDLAILGMSKRFITFLFGTPTLYTPQKMVRFFNVGAYVAP